MDLQIISESRRGAYARERMAHFADRCRQGGLAVTPQRLAIVEALLATTDHPRAETVFEAVRKLHPHISLATVHRTLETLCQIGEARKVTPLHDSARYDGNLAPHHHVVCVRCRRVRDIEIPELEQVLHGRAAIGDFKVLGSSLEIQALCAQCGEARRPRRVRASSAPKNRLP